MLGEKEKFIDIEQVLKKRKPGLMRWIPRFVLNYVKRKIHEDLVNECIHLHGDKFEHDFNDACLEFLKAKVIVENSESIPKSGGVIIVSNHPLGGLDGMAMIHAISKVRGDVRFMVNDVLKNLKNFGEIFVGVNKMGVTPGEALKAVDKFYSSEAASLVFPAGLVSRKLKGEIRDLDWRKSFITKAIQYNKPILPAFVDGRNSEFFYNFSNWRKRLGIKANIEMFFLADEMVRQKDKTIRIRFGDLIQPSELNRVKNNWVLAQEIKEKVYKLGDDHTR